MSFLLNAINPFTLPPESMLSEVKERLEDPKYDIDFGRIGVGVDRGIRKKGIGMSTTQKGAILRKCLNTFVPHCSS